MAEHFRIGIGKETELLRGALERVRSALEEG
jgi:hypothetical protein